MSKISVSSPATGTATFTLTAPAGTSTDRTLTLPNATGTVALTSQIPAASTIASTAEAQAGTNNSNFITPLRMREGFNASGSAPIYACRAWVNFNGTGTPSIRASGNVSSVVRNGTGNYTVNFATAMPDANYAGVGGGRRANDVGSGGEASPNLAFSNFSVGSVRMGSFDNNNDFYEDSLILTAAFFR